ncbi:unnamed protein product, partial [Adineta ricciae]
MSSMTTRKVDSSGKTYCTKSHDQISVETTGLAMGINGNHSFEATPSPSSIASTSTIEHSMKDRHRILSSTLKNDHSHLTAKRRSRFERLFHHTQLINRHYMMNMTNILLQMQREIHKLKRRTSRMEQSVVKQTKMVQPVIRIPRLTRDELSTICIFDNDNDVHENEATTDGNNNEITLTHPRKSITSKSIKRLKSKHKRMKAILGLKNKSKRAIWINNRQKAIDPNKYCSTCRHEFSKRSNFLTHVRNIHKGKCPPLINEQDQSLLEMNEESATRDHSGVVSDEDAQSLQALNKSWATNQQKSHARSSVKLSREPKRRLKLKCDVCNKFFRSDYLKSHRQRAHHDQQILSSSSEGNSSSEQSETASNRSLNENVTSNEMLRPCVSNTPATITIAEMDSDDAPILFRNDSAPRIVLAVTCLESYQIELVEKFIEKFSSRVCQTASIDSRTTHLITNDEKSPLRSPLSMKLIEAIAHHCFCVSYRWISDCLNQDRILDETSYEIEGDDTDVLPHGGPRRSRFVPNRHSLFENICFMIKCTENSDIRMTNERLEDLITTCGGQIITCVTQRLL